MKYICIVIGLLVACFVVFMMYVRKSQQVCGTCAAFIRTGTHETCGVLSERGGTPTGHTAERDRLKTQAEDEGCRWWTARKVTQYTKDTHV